MSDPGQAPATATGQAGAAPIDPGTTLGPVALTVADLDRAQAFYERAIGLRTLERSADTVRLGADGRSALVELVGRPDGPPPPPRATGLFHLALLVPSRAELARALRRVVDAGWRFTGASDHFVSEALYLDDPEGNGIELYRDRPRTEWRYDDGELRMGTVALDLDAVMAERPPDGSDPGVAPETAMGHVHLKVSDLGAAGAFYTGVLGFEITVRGYPGALFVSAGGYHHHVGLNTWMSAGGAAPPAGARGLRRFTVVLPSAEALGRVSERSRAAGAEPEPADGGVLLTDPAGNRVALRA